MKPVKIWVLIADGARARIVEQTGVGRALREVSGSEFSDDHLRNRDIVADRPGRSFDSGGRGRHAMVPPSDPQDLREKGFLTRLAGFVDEQYAAGRFDRLVIAAPPSALGYLRSVLSEQVRQVVSAEVASDLTRLPNSKLAKHLEDVLAV